jgi:hypothetical protein
MVSGGLLRSAWGTLLELLLIHTAHRRPRQDVMFPCRLPRPSERCRLVLQPVRRASLHLGLAFYLLVAPSTTSSPLLFL